MSDQNIPYLTDPNGHEHLLAEDANTLGRAVENTIVVTSKKVSRAHALIRRQGRRCLLEDCGSANGTFLNEERIVAPVELRDGDCIQLGDVRLDFHDPDTTVRDDLYPLLEIDVAAGVVRVDRKVVQLSPKEFALLVYLHEHAGQVCSKDEISQAVWPEYHEAVYDYQVENLIRRLRTKIEFDPAEPQLLLTMRGLGYKLVNLA
ncbi:MAG: winged helix-turn-helix domain-containing protein [Anaerolineales bacterium]|nr:winged helix-turn-helix domain-containing protein [Anaerolineales bacterium]